MPPCCRLRFMTKLSMIVLTGLFLALVTPAKAQGTGLDPRACPKSSVDLITEKFVKDTLSYLASDEMKGRDTGSEELRRAGRWIAKRAESMGLKPLFGDSWYQGERTGDITKAKGSWSWKKKTFTIDEDHVLTGGPAEDCIKDASCIVWRGAWSRNNPDREEQVRGRVVVLPVDNPKSPRTRAIIHRRARQLGREGALAVVLQSAVEGFEPKPSGGPPILVLPKSLKITIPEETKTIANLKLSLEIPAKEELISFNVGAFLPGSDPKLKNDVIVFSAHLDHIGVSSRPRKDTIYNGADDDATGCTGVLALARAFAEAKTPPKRSLVFLWFYGEESGMLGSRHYVSHPARPLKNHRAVFNLEMLGRPDDIEKNEAWVTGWNVSNFGELIAASSKAGGIRFYEHPQRSRMLFGSSDNISFAMRGVVAHSISAGSLHKDYHQPSDEVSKIDIKNMTSVIRGLFHAGWAMADGGALPQYNENTRYADRAKELQSIK